MLLIFEGVQLRERKFSRVQFRHQRLANEAAGTHHRNPQAGGLGAHRVITGVSDTTSAHCARKRRK